MGETAKSSKLDETIEQYMGEFGWRQFIQALIVSLSWLFDAQQAFIAIFTDADPTWHCTTTTNNTCTPGADRCRLPRDSWSWDSGVGSSTVLEWSLEYCAGSFITGLPASSFFTGCLAGGFVLCGLADSSLGRKNLLLISSLIMSLSGALTAISPNLWIYVTLRFLSGFGRGAIGSSALVLTTELVGKKWRGQVGIMGFFCFTLGFLSLPLMAYLNNRGQNNSWRTLYLWTCVPGLFYCLVVHFLVHESPRWLYIHGRREEFMETVKSMANKRWEDGDNNCLTHSLMDSNNDDDETTDVENNWSSLYSTMRTLAWEKQWAFRRLIAVMGMGCGMGMVYYGMPLAVESLASHNLYVNVALNAVAELPAAFVTLFMIGGRNRRSLVLGFASVSGVCSLLCAVALVTNVGLQLWLELVSFFSACTAFNVLLIYTLELFPTCVRNSALSMVRQAVVLGGVFSPLLVAAGRNNPFYSYGCFGVTIGLSGFLVACLPETRGSAFCDTMDEEEQKHAAATTC